MFKNIIKNLLINSFIFNNFFKRFHTVEVVRRLYQNGVKRLSPFIFLCFIAMMRGLLTLSCAISPIILMTVLVQLVLGEFVPGITTSFNLILAFFVLWYIQLCASIPFIAVDTCFTTLHPAVRKYSAVQSYVFAIIGAPMAYIIVGFVRIVDDLVDGAERKFTLSPLGTHILKIIFQIILFIALYLYCGFVFGGILYAKGPVPTPHELDSLFKLLRNFPLDSNNNPFKVADLYAKLCQNSYAFKWVCHNYGDGRLVSEEKRTTITNFINYMYAEENKKLFFPLNRLTTNPANVALLASNLPFVGLFNKLTLYFINDPVLDRELIDAVSVDKGGVIVKCHQFKYMNNYARFLKSGCNGFDCLVYNEANREGQVKYLVDNGGVVHLIENVTTMTPYRAADALSNYGMGVVRYDEDTLKLERVLKRMNLTFKDQGAVVGKRFTDVIHY